MELVNGLLYFCQKCYLSTLKVDTGTKFLIKKLSNQLFANYLFADKTTLEPIKPLNFKNCLKSWSTFSVLEAYSEPWQTPEMLNIFEKYSTSSFWQSSEYVSVLICLL